MPVYPLEYRPYAPEHPGRLRWLVVMAQEFRTMRSGRVFNWLLLLAGMSVFLRFMQVLAHGIIMAQPDHPWHAFVTEIAFLRINGRLFFDFLRIQAFLVLLLHFHAGAGMICNDRNNQTLEVYFSKPLTWRDYLAGKLGALLALGYGLTALPALFLILMHHLMAPEVAALPESLGWAQAIVLYASAIVVSSALAVLAASSVAASQNYAILGVLILLSGVTVLGVSLGDILREFEYHLLAYPFTLEYLGHRAFGLPYYFEDRPRWPMYYVLGLCGTCLAVLVWRVRGLERAR